MRASLEFLAGLLERGGSARVAREDLLGPHAGLLAQLQGMGILAREPAVNPRPACTHCGEGMPSALRGRLLCNRCASAVDARHLLLWPLDVGPFLRWLAGQPRLRGGVRRIDDALWHLGTWDGKDAVSEYFFLSGGPLSGAGKGRLAAYRNALVFFGAAKPDAAADLHVPTLSLLEVLRLEGSLAAVDLGRLLGRRHNMRFDRHSGTLWVGDERAGEVPVGSRELAFLACLAAQLDRFVPYADLKHEVLRQTGSTDATEEATFCQNLKSRIKKKWIPEIDRLIATTNKGDGYRLRAHAGA